MLMNHQIIIFRNVRDKMLDLLNNLSLEEANSILPNRKNNILWHIGHVLLAQQYVIYYHSGFQMNVPPNFIQLFGSGSSAPEIGYSDEQFLEIKGLVLNLKDMFISDYQNGIFNNFKGFFSDFFQIESTTIDEAIQTNNYHEAYHYGCAHSIFLSLKK